MNEGNMEGKLVRKKMTESYLYEREVAVFGEEGDDDGLPSG